MFVHIFDYSFVVLRAEVDEFVFFALFLEELEEFVFFDVVLDVEPDVVPDVVFLLLVFFSAFDE